MHSRVDISVVIPTYNGSAFISEALDSVFAQTLLPKEIVLVDDASSDGTPELVERMAESAPVELRIIRLASNSGGPAHPINVGVRSSSAHFVLVLDQDDLLLCDALGRHVIALSAAPQSAFSFTLGAWMSPKEGLLQSQTVIEALMHVANPIGANWMMDGRWALRLFMEKGNFCAGFPAVMFRKRAWKNVGGVSTKWRGAADYDFFCSLTDEGDLIFVPEIGFHRRAHEKSLTGVLNGDSLCETVDIILKRAMADDCWDGDRGFRRGVRRHLLHVCRRMRHRRRHSDALRLHARVFQHIGFEYRQASELAKLGLVWALGGLGAVSASSRARVMRQPAIKR